MPSGTQERFEQLYQEMERCLLCMMLKEAWEKFQSSARDLAVALAQFAYDRRLSRLRVMSDLTFDQIDDHIRAVLVRRGRFQAGDLPGSPKTRYAAGRYRDLNAAAMGSDEYARYEALLQDLDELP